MKNLGEKETRVAAARRDKFHSKLFVEGAKFVAQTETHHNSLGKLSPKSTEKYLLTIYKDRQEFRWKSNRYKTKEWMSLLPSEKNLQQIDNPANSTKKL